MLHTFAISTATTRLLGLRMCQWETFLVKLEGGYLLEVQRFSLESVDKLHFLQTLDLSDTEFSSMEELPPVDTFCKIRQLRHLYLPSFPYRVKIEGKLRLMSLSQLETLHNFQSEFFDLKDLIHLQKLRSLQGCCVGDEESLVQITDYICGSNLIRWIGIRIDRCNLNGQQESDALRKLLKIPNVTLQLCISFTNLSKLPRLETVDFSILCPGLVDLDLWHVVDIEDDIMQALGKFPNLKKLYLRGIEFGGEEMICDAGSFPALEELDIYWVDGKFELRIDEAAMPNLSTLKINRCSRINFTIPERLRLFAQLADNS